MKIKADKKETTRTEAAPHRSLRGKAGQKPQTNHAANRFFVSALKLMAKAVALSLMAAFLISIFVYAFTSEKFALRLVDVQGCKQQDGASLEAIIRQEFPSDILRIDLPKLRARLENETWVNKVEVRRILPSKLVVYVEERTPNAILEVGGELMLADTEGILLDKYDSKYGKLDMPVLKGVLGNDVETYRRNQQENSERVTLGLRMLGELNAGSAAFTRNISEVDLADKQNLRILLVDDTAEIFLGDRDFLKRFQMLLANMDKYRELKSQYREIASIDLRFTDQIIYRPRRVPGAAGSETASAKP